jgi:hypothetical protein
MHDPTTPPRGVQLIDRSQWRAIAAVAALAAVALAASLYGLRRPPSAPPPERALIVTVEPPPACPAVPACPACAACPACPGLVSPRRGRAADRTHHDAR